MLLWKLFNTVGKFAIHVVYQWAKSQSMFTMLLKTYETSSIILLYRTIHKLRCLIWIFCQEVFDIRFSTSRLGAILTLILRI